MEETDAGAVKYQACVAAEQDMRYVREEIVQKYQFTKVNIITSGGA